MYAPTEWAVIVVGALPGSENWANRWTVLETDAGSAIEDAAAAFRSLYNLFSGVMAAGWTASSVTCRNLSSGDVVTPSWDLVSGDAESNPLPTECALRISLSAAGNRHGGPFISGFGAGFQDADGQFTSSEAVIFRNQVNALITDLAAVDFELRLDSPTDELTLPLTGARIGRTFDVIRKRRNKIAEEYLPVTL